VLLAGGRCRFATEEVDPASLVVVDAVELHGLR
jgi:hypothetical protein